MLDKDHRRRLERAMNRTVDDWMGDLAATLLGQTGRYQDRDASDTWMEFEHFGEFYAAQKHQFVVGYSSPDVLALRVLRLYMHRQLSAVVQREAGLSSSESFERPWASRPTRTPCCQCCGNAGPRSGQTS